MKAKLVRESLNEDFYDDNDLGLIDKLVDYIVGKVDSDVSSSKLRKYYMSQLQQFPDISELIMKAEMKPKLSMGDILRLGDLIIKKLEGYNVLDFNEDDILWSEDGWSYDT